MAQCSGRNLYRLSKGQWRYEKSRNPSRIGVDLSIGVLDWEMVPSSLCSPHVVPQLSVILYDTVIMRYIIVIYKFVGFETFSNFYVLYICGRKLNL